MASFSSPRRRRRLIWLGALVLMVAGILVLNQLLPSHGGPVRVSPINRARPAGATPAEIAAASRAEAAVQPLANRFVDELVNHRDLERAYALLAPKVRDRYSLLDWRAGRDLPLTGAAGTGGASVAFSGAKTVGFVASYSAGSVLFAVRFDKLPVLGWRVAYMHQGHSSSHVTEADYSPAGFAPGSHRDTLGTWLILLGGFVALVGLVAVADRRLSR